MVEKNLVKSDWFKKHQAIQVKYSQLRKSFPFKHEEEAVRNVGQYILEREKSTKEQAGSIICFDFISAKEIVRKLTETTQEGSQKTFFGVHKS